MANAYFLNQYFTTNLNVGGGIDASQTTGIVLLDVTGVDITKPGIACLSYSEPLNTSNAEWITYTSIDGSNELQGVTRGAEGFTAKTHANQVAVAFPLSESHINQLATALSIGGSATNAVTSTVALTSSLSTPATELITASYVGNAVTDTSDTTPNPTGDRKNNEYYVTALAGAAEFQAPSGTPSNGNKLLIRVLDDGTSRALTWNAIYDGTLADLPSATTISKTLYCLFVYNSEAVKWELLATGEES